MLLFIGISLLNKKTFVIPSYIIQRVVQYHNKELLTGVESGELKFLQNKIIVTIPILKLNKKDTNNVQFNNINISLDLFNFSGDFRTQLNKVVVGDLINLTDQPEMIDFMRHHYLVCDGNVKANFKLFTLKTVELILSSKQGWHDPKKDNLDKLQLKEFNASIVYQSDKLSIKQLNLEYINSFNASVAGDFSFDDKELLLAEFQTNINLLPIEYLDSFWPKEFFPQIQNWVTTHFSKGMISKAYGNFKFTEEDFKATLPRKEAVEAVIEFNNITLNYLQGYSPISQLTGIIKFDGAGLYVNADSGIMLNNKLNNIEVGLPFDTYILTFKTNIIGNINKFEQFIPQDLLNKLKGYNLNYAEINGSTRASVALSIPIFEEFKFSNLKLDINANLENVALDKIVPIRFTKGNLEIYNNHDSIRVKLFSEKIILLEFESYHNLDTNQKKINVLTEITFQDNFIFADKVALKGTTRSQVNLDNNIWQINIGLNEAEVKLLPIDYRKPMAMPLSFQCSGNFDDNNITSNSCALSGKDIRGKLEFNYSIANNSFTKLILDNIKIGMNDFSMNMLNDKDIYNYTLNAKYLDFSKFSMKGLSTNSQKKINFNLAFKIDQMRMPNQHILQNISAKLIQIGKNPIDIDFKVFDQDKKLTIVKIKKNNQNGYLLHSDSASTFTQAFGIYNNIKKGNLWIEMYPKKLDADMSYYGTIKLTNFAFTNTSALTKIILGISSALNSPQAIAKALQGGSLQADSFDASLNYYQGIISVKDALIKGSSYIIKLDGIINLNDNTLAFKGLYVPSVYGINELVSNIPVVGNIISGGKKSALIGANFSIKGSTSNPDVFLNPLTALTPGFIRNLFNQ